MVSRELLIEQIPHLRRYARVLLGHARVDEADDLVQDTLERACAKWSLWQSRRSLRPWLFSIMHNLFVDQCAVRSGANVTALEDLPEALHPQQPADQDLRVEAMQVLAALQHLHVPLREVLLLVAVENFSYAEVAKALGIPPGTVMSRLSRARTQLWHLTAGEEAQPRPVLRVIDRERSVG